MQNDQSLLGAADGVPRCRNYRQMTVTEQGLVLGAGTLLAKMGEDGLCLDGEEERILTLLAIAYRGDVPGAALGMFRRVSKHWQGGDKCLAAIHLAQSGLPEIDEDAAYVPVAGGRADRRGHDAARACAGVGASPGSV